jgi:hypothetical protein
MPLQGANLLSDPRRSTRAGQLLANHQLRSDLSAGVASLLAISSKRQLVAENLNAAKNSSNATTKTVVSVAKRGSYPHVEHDLARHKFFVTIGNKLIADIMRYRLITWWLGSMLLVRNWCCGPLLHRHSCGRSR